MSVIAILGATGQIGRALAAEFARDQSQALVLLARDPARIATPPGRDCATGHLETLPHHEADIIVNCIGAGDPARVRDLGSALVPVTEQYDRLCLDALQDRPGALYVFLSSGAVHGPRGDGDWYAESKRAAEARHRLRAADNIVDLRVYGFVSPLLDLRGRFLLAEAFSAIRDNRELVVSDEEICRDYMHPADLAQLISCCARNLPLNRAVEAYGREPASKDTILRTCSREFGLRVRTLPAKALDNPAGAKMRNYYAVDRWAASIGYTPAYSCTEAVVAAGRAILSGGDS